MRNSSRTGKVALITGAAMGIGCACVERFLAEGWSVIGWDIDAGSDPRVSWTRIDISDWDAVLAAAGEVPPLAAVVMVHGFSSHCGAYRHVAAARCHA